MKVKLGDLLEEYSERNINNEYKPVAVGKYGIRHREDIYSKDLAKDYSRNKLIRKGTLTIGMGSNQIDIGLLNDDKIYSVSPAYHTYKIKNINYEYLGFLLKAHNTRMFTLYAKRGSRQGKSLDLKRWLNYEIIIHDNYKQKLIVRNLKLIQKIISKDEIELVKLDDLVKARFVEMFGNREGKQAVLKDICNFYSGTGFPIEYQGNKKGQYAFYKVADISRCVQENRKNLDYAYNYVDQKVVDEIKGKTLPKGTVVFAKIGEALRLNRRAITSSECLVDNNVMGIKPLSNQSIRIEYFYEYMKNLDMNTLCSSTTMPSIKKSTLEQQTIIIPKQALQEQFSGFVHQVDKSKFAWVYLFVLSMIRFYTMKKTS